MSEPWILFNTPPVTLLHRTRGHKADRRVADAPDDAKGAITHLRTGFPIASPVSLLGSRWLLSDLGSDQGWTTTPYLSEDHNTQLS